MPEPIPTPAPPVTRYAIHLGLRGSPLSHCVSPEVVDDGEWCKWSDVQAILLQRAQEIAALEAVCEQRDLKIEQLHAALTAQAQAIAQVQAAAATHLQRELRAYLDTLVITGDNIGEVRRSLFVPWDSAWNSVVRDETARREQSAEAARVSRAPQPEQAK
jgi:hypothetical protein